MTSYIGKRIVGPSGSQQIFGYPLPNYLPSIVKNTLGAVPWYITDETTLFDLSTITEDHEVVAYVYVVDTSIHSSVSWHVEWRRVIDNAKVSSWDTVWPAPPKDSYYPPGSIVYGWIGWLSEATHNYLGGIEIMDNGDYYINIKASGGVTLDYTIDFSVVNIHSPILYLSTPTYYGCRWSVYNLSNNWDDGNYIEIVLCTDSNHYSGQSAEPSGILSRQYPPTQGTVKNTPSMDFSAGLNPGRSYTLYAYTKVKIDSSNELWYSAGFATIEIPDLPVATLETSSPSATGCDWRITDLNQLWDDGYYISCCLSSDPNHPSGSSSSPYPVLDTQTPPTQGTVNRTSIKTMVDKLEPSTTYTLYAYVRPINGLWYPAGSSQITTIAELTLAVPSVIDIWGTISGISLELGSVEGADMYYAICNGQQLDSQVRMFTWSGLNPSTTYDVEYWADDTTGVIEESPHTIIQVSTQSATRPSLFYWTWASYGVPGSTKDPDKIIYVTAEEWNDFTQNIYDVWDYKGWTLPDPPIYTVTQGDDMMVSDINPVIMAINLRNPTGITIKASGYVDNILPEDFNVLMEKLNQIT